MVDTLEFIKRHREDDVRQLALKRVPNEGIDLPWALTQIAGWQAARRKIPSWAVIDSIVYPQHISMEQCSSDRTSEYKAKLIDDSCLAKADSEVSFVDLTGGFGVDFVAIAKTLHQHASAVINHAVYVERSDELCTIARNNFPLLGVDAEVVCTTAEEYLHTLKHTNLLFVDPARRDGAGRKMVGIADCTPDILSLKDEMLRKADMVMIKLSPMLDWHKAVADLGECVHEVHIVSVDNECKELLLIVRGERSEEKGERILYCVNDDDEVLRVELSSLEMERRVESRMAPPLEKGWGGFLYEPNASIMKSGCFAELCAKYGVLQIGKNSNLFVSDTMKETFPGRKFVVEAVSSMNKREMKETLGDMKRANVAVRNFPMNAEELRRRLKLIDGGDDYLFGTTLTDGSHCLLLCKKC